MGDTRKKDKAKQNPTVPQFAKSIYPGTNFYGHINGNWIRHVKMPSYRTSYGVSEEIEDSIQPSLMRIVTDAQQEVLTKPNKEIDKDILLLGSLQQSAMDHSSNDLNIKFIKNFITNLRCIRDANDVAATIAEFSKFRIPSPIPIYSGPEEIHSTDIRLILGSATLGLPDSSYYRLNGTGRPQILEAYNNLLVKLGDYFEINNMDQFVGIEHIIAEALDVVRGEEELQMKGRELRTTYKSVPWDIFAKSAFDWTPGEFDDFTFLLSSQNWIKYINRWFKTWTIDNWRVWFSGQVLLYTLPILPSPFNTLYFEFFEHRLKDQYKKMPQNIVGLKMCKQWLYAPLGKKYIECCIDPQLKRNVIKLSEEIVHAALKRLENVEWMEPKTRMKAIKKVKSIHIGVAYPNVMPKEPEVDLNPEQFIKNIFALGNAEFKKDLKHANTKLNPERWEDSIFEVNAYYYNEGNRLILPAGILKYPFYDFDSSDGWNFGGIGATIGHELTHAFDMDGKDYDENGNRAPWWTINDNRNYNQKTKAIINLYNKTKYFSQYINGTLTLSENISDLGGLALSLMALKARLDKKKVSQEDRKKELCNFFTSYAVSWRTKEKRKKAMQSLFTDLHAPPIARVNNIVRQFDDWYECFDIKPGNVLYTSPEERIRIF